MGKHLSYLKCKHLKALGYKSDTECTWLPPGGHCTGQGNYYASEPILVGKTDSTLAIAAPDCDDLLSLMIGYDFNLYPFFDEDIGENIYVVKVCNEPFSAPDFYGDVSAIEALGKAYIGILEELISSGDLVLSAEIK